MEVAMNDTDTLGLADTSRRRYSLTTLRRIIAIWGERQRFRWDLEHMLMADPHLIADIGLTRRQAEAEIAKHFWQG
jgi:uncharacterized protein YjiS (DUF1127 family)